MDLTVTETDYGADDLSWLGSAHGFESADEVTLVSDDFLSVFTDGRVPSGVCLALITGGDDDGRYTRYGPASSEVQSVGLGSATAGTVTIGVDGETTAAIAFNANKAAVQAALNLLSNVDDDHTITVGGADFPGVMTFTFGGLWAEENVPALVVTPTGLTGGTVAVADVTAGGTVPAGRSNDFAGHLKKGVKVTADHMVGAAIVRHGKVIEANLPTNHGLDAAAKAAAAGRIIYL